MDIIHQLPAEKQKQLFEYLSGFITPHKLGLFNANIMNRTRYLTVVVENLYQPHNASAVLRSCDVFGIQDVHIIENRNPYSVNQEIALGASKWLSLHRYADEGSAINLAMTSLRGKGYRIVATSPHENGYEMENLPLDSKTALIFGTELEGLSPEAIQHADAFVKIPMYGFTESLNISVSAGISLYALTTRLRKSDINWHLDESQTMGVFLQWACNVVRNPDALIKSFLEKNK